MTRDDLLMRCDAPGWSRGAEGHDFAASVVECCVLFKYDVGVSYEVLRAVIRLSYPSFPRKSLYSTVASMNFRVSSSIASDARETWKASHGIPHCQFATFWRDAIHARTPLSLPCVKKLMLIEFRWCD